MCGGTSGPPLGLSLQLNWDPSSSTGPEGALAVVAFVLHCVEGQQNFCLETSVIDD